MSDTPRTDAVMEQPHLSSLEDDLEQHARTLERELNEALHVPRPEPSGDRFQSLDDDGFPCQRA